MIITFHFRVNLKMLKMLIDLLIVLLAVTFITIFSYVVLRKYKRLKKVSLKVETEKIMSLQLSLMYLVAIRRDGTETTR